MAESQPIQQELFRQEQQEPMRTCRICQRTMPLRLFRSKNTQRWKCPECQTAERRHAYAKKTIGHLPASKKSRDSIGYQERRARREQGLCFLCDNPTADAYVYCQECRDARSITDAAKFKKWAEDRRAAGKCRHCYRDTVDGKALCAVHLERRRQGHIRKHRKVKEQVFAAYGGYRCVCCGVTEKEFLHIDHINGNGNEHRRKIATEGGSRFYWWLWKNNFPPGFQVLCANCNLARGFHSYCPCGRWRETVLPAIGRMRLTY